MTVDLAAKAEAFIDAVNRLPVPRFYRAAAVGVYDARAELRAAIAEARRAGLDSDRAALDLIAYWLKDPEWGVGMLEDIAETVAATGRSLDNEQEVSTWDRH